MPGWCWNRCPSHTASGSAGSISTRTPRSTSELRKHLVHEKAREGRSAPPGNPLPNDRCRLRHPLLRLVVIAAVGLDFVLSDGSCAQQPLEPGGNGVGSSPDGEPRPGPWATSPAHPKALP